MKQHLALSILEDWISVCYQLFGELIVLELVHQLGNYKAQVFESKAPRHYQFV